MALVALAPFASLAKAEPVDDAIKARESLSSSICRLLRLEQQLHLEIKESGQTPQEFFARKADDPDPRVQRVMQLTKEIDDVSKVNLPALRRAKELSALTPEEGGWSDLIDRN
jgi:chromosome segregation ATPase